MARAGGWEFFLSRWGMLYEAVAGTVKAAEQAQPQLTQAQAARLDVLIKKALRTKEVLQQLQDAEQRHAQLRAQFAPLMAQLPELQAAAAPAPAQHNGVHPHKQVFLQKVGLTDAQRDLYGIRVALNPAKPFGAMTWGDVASGLKRAGAAALALLSGPRMDDLMRFSLERQTLVHELCSMAAQLEGDVELPPIEPLREEGKALDGLLTTLQQVQEAQMQSVQHHLSALDLPVLEHKLQLCRGQDWQGSATQAALARLKLLLAALEASRTPPSEAWLALEEDLKALEAAVMQHQQQRQGKHGNANVQRYLQQLYGQLARQGYSERDQLTAAHVT